MKKISGGVCAAKGFSAAGIHAGIRKNKTKPDLALIVSETPATAAGCYTQNRVKGAPIWVTKKNIENGIARAIVCNSGNANTCNSDGIEVAERMCSIVAENTDYAEIKQYCFDALQHCVDEQIKKIRKCA